ncbi:Hypothetical predicted protein [Mytilus galloprovincialis]|nr:Hypothetical predicted protein [Mytilus galloprovincialis]
MPVIKKDKVASFLTPGKGAYSFAQGSGQSISEAQRKQLENIHIAVNEDDISIEQPNQVTKRRGELKRLFSERSKTRGSRGRGCGRGRGGRRGGKSDNVKRKSSKVLLENNKPKRKTAKVLVYEDDNDMEVPDSREMSPVIVLEDVVLNSSLLREASVLMENMDFSVDPTAKEPTETPEQPEETQEQPKETQEQPEETQEQSEETQEQPEETQEQETQEQSEETQEQPEETQEQPEETQEQPKETQEQPEETQEQPKETQEQPEETQEQQHKKQGNTRTTKENTRTTKGNTRTTRGNTEQQRNNKNTKTQEQPEDILSKDDFVLVELPIEKTSRTKQFIGKIISVSEHDIDVSFMKKNKTGKFIWPEVMDQSMVERRSVKRKLKPPAQIAKRRSIEMFFSDMS